MTDQALTPETIVWEDLGFSYIKTDYRYISYYKNGEWDEGQLTEDNTLHISEGSTALHYGQQVFEGTKAYRRKDGNINLFRPQENAKRMNASGARLLMPEVPVEKFVDALEQVVRANEAWVPPYGTGANLYIRPLLIGVGDNIGVKPAEEYIFTVFCIPVGPYFKDGMAPAEFVITEYDRAAPKGTGAAKVGGNYAASLLPGKEAKENNFGDAIYMSPNDHKTIEEVGSANFFGITKDNKFITPDSPSVLPGITRNSLMKLAEEELGLTVEMTRITLDMFDDIVEAGACGTAAVITPISRIYVNGDYHEFYSDTEVGPKTQKLYDLLTGIQTGDIEGPEDWTKTIEI